MNDFDSKYGAHDVNAIFSFKGVGHHMNQRGGGWGHAVTKDWVRWERLPNSLFGNGDWDGSLTVLGDKPVILFDCTHDEVCQVNNTVESGDPPIVGVARPADASDPKLVVWTKDPKNPIVIDKQGGYSGPSNIWSPSPGKWSFVMILGQATALYSTTDPTLHSWKQAPQPFFPHRGGGGGLFFPVPGTDDKLWMLQSDIGPSGDGIAYFAMGSYDTTSEKFTQSSGASGLGVLDFSAGNRFFELGYAPVAGGGKAQRLLQCGWAASAGATSTIVREVSYDAELFTLRGYPVPELATLRGAALLNTTSSVVLKGGGKALAIGSGTAAAASDIVLLLELPTAPWALSLDVSAKMAGVMTLSGDGSSKNLTVGLVGTKGTYSFSLPAAATEVELRVLLDNVILEVFVAKGIAAGTASLVGWQGSGGLAPADFAPAVRATRGSVTFKSAQAWTMGCAYPASGI